ncbi:MAG: hypothetical protein PHO06_00510 [Clostridia bacterium]|nr:hypothetical protein [Clostridia bacterium]
MTPEEKKEVKEFWVKYKETRDKEYKEAKKKDPNAKKDTTLDSIENKERNYRRNEVKFSRIQGDGNNNKLDGYLAKHTHEKDDRRNQRDEQMNSKVMYRTIYRFNGMDRELLLAYMHNEKQKDIADKYNISESAISQRIDILLEKYRVMLCNDYEFKKTKQYKTMLWENKIDFRNYIEEIRANGTFKININQVQDFIKEVQQAIKRTINTGADRNIKEKLQKQIDYSNLDDKYIEDMNKAFADLGIEAHFEKLKTFKGNVIQILKMVDDFIEEIKEKSLK